MSETISVLMKSKNVILTYENHLKGMNCKLEVLIYEHIYMSCYIQYF